MPLSSYTTHKFKSDCPKCGGKGKIKTKVDMYLGTFSKAHCYKCGWHSSGGSLYGPARRMTWTPPAKEEDLGVKAA